MKLFNYHILKQKTLDERLTEARRNAVVIPNKMISLLLKKQASQPMVRQILETLWRLKHECIYLRDKVRNV